MREKIDRVIEAALTAVDPKVFIPEIIRRENECLWIAEKRVKIKPEGKVYLVAIGKAALSMSAATSMVLGELVTSGIVLTKHLNESIHLPKNYQILTGGHPVPTQNSVNATRAILSLLDNATENDLVLFLISGGGSALLTCPKAHISLSDMQQFSSMMLACGADIREFNTLRKHIDSAKGGGLAQHAAPATCVSIILSDVTGSPLDVIASGPTVPDPSTYADAIQILEKFELTKKVPSAIWQVLQNGANGGIPETLKDSDPHCARICNILAADNRRAALAAAACGRELGFNSVVLSTQITGEAREAGKILTGFLSELDRSDAFIQRPALLVFGGETTVKIHGDGLGGRNQECALGAVEQMAAAHEVAFVTLATDGEDGPTDAAGAIVTTDTLEQGKNAGLSIQDYLNNNDSYHYFDKLDALIKTGPSGTNVNDLSFLFAW